MVSLTALDFFHREPTFGNHLFERDTLAAIFEICAALENSLDIFFCHGLVVEHALEKARDSSELGGRELIHQFVNMLTRILIRLDFHTFSVAQSLRTGCYDSADGAV